MHPLEGLTVVSVEQAVAAPYATRQLADLGARVIKVEREGCGDFARDYDASVKGMSSHFVWLGRSKESVALDLKSDDGRDVVAAIAARADVFVQNLAPGAAARLGLDAPALRERHPSLIHCSISGYGDGGPYTDKKAYDLLVQCESGLLAITGTPDEPVKVGISVADIAAGMYAYSGVLTALLRRARTGQGATIEVSMLEALAEWMGFPMYSTAYGSSQPPRTGASHAAIAPYGPFACQGGDRSSSGSRTSASGRPSVGRCSDRQQLLANRGSPATPCASCTVRSCPTSSRRCSAVCRSARSWVAWSRRASPTRGCATSPVSSPTNSWSHGTGGARWSRRWAP